MVQPGISLSSGSSYVAAISPAQPSHNRAINENNANISTEDETVLDMTLGHQNNGMYDPDSPRGPISWNDN
jgi:hypothetical protein